MNRNFYSLDRARFSAFSLYVALLAAAGVAQPLEQSLVAALANKSNSQEEPRTQRDRSGRITFLGAPPGDGFVSESKGGATTVASAFVKQHAEVFGLAPESELEALSTLQLEGVQATRFGQTLAGLPVFASAVAVQVGDDGLIRAVHNDTVRIAPKLGYTPSFTADEAVERGKFHVAALHDGQPGSPTGPPELVVFAPSVLDLPGDTRLAWLLSLRSAGMAFYCDRVLVDALDGRILFDYPLIHSALSRRIHDAANQFVDPGTLARLEGGGTNAVADVNRAYNFTGDTYTFYSNEHSRDSIDNAGMQLNVTVRYCDGFCPWPNAHWDGDASRMRFGSGFVADDVVAHEYTHGVTQYTSGLIYQGQSGALNESLSDIWGEFVDLSNGRGTDTAAVRWLQGEDLEGGAIRNMSVPGTFQHPGTTCSPYYYSGDFDNGGVHINSGVTNKLAYLLTDGNAFNGEVVTGMGITAVARLLYAVQAASLTPGSNFADFYAGLTQAGINLGLSDAERQNIEAAARAVQITPATTCIAPPSNDLCENAIPILPDTPVAGTNIDASGSLSVMCNDHELFESGDVWYSFTPPTSTNYVVSLCGSTDYDATLTVFEGSCAAGSLLHCDDDSCGALGGPSKITAWLRQSETYFVRVDGWGGAQGNFTVEIAALEEPFEIEGESAAHTLDGNANGILSLSELLRGIQLHNAHGFYCAANPEDTEDGYQTEPGSQTCPPHDADYRPTDWQITLTELLRSIQIFNAGSYQPCPDAFPPTEDGFCPNV